MCATDYYQHVLYAYRSGETNRYNDVKAERQAAIKRINWLLNWDSRNEDGPSADYKVLCDQNGIAVGSFVVSGSPSFTNIVNAAMAAGYDEPNANYVIFMDSSDPADPDEFCGIGQIDADEDLELNNMNNVGGAYGVSWRNEGGPSGCWNGSTPMHENGHNQGAVQFNAPHSTGTFQPGTSGGRHCNQEEDVMCYVPDNGTKNQTEVVSCPDNLHFDCNHNDYFDPNPEAGGYLSSNWNIGSTLNRFMQFGFGSVSVYDDDPVPLTDGVGRNETSGGPGQWSYYQFTVPSGTDHVDFSLSGSSSCSSPPESCSPDLDLYARRYDRPNFEEYRCRKYGVTTSHTCTITTDKSGLWYIGVRNFIGSSVPFTVEADYVN